MISAIPLRNSIEKLEKAGIPTDSLKAAAKLMWRAVLLGAVLYLMLGDDPDTNLKLNGVSFLAAFIWAHYDGVFARQVWWIAFVEAIFLQFASVQFGNLLALGSGNPLVGS